MNSTSILKTTRWKHLREEFIHWLPIMAGMAALYVPSLVDLFQGLWSKDEQMHGPIVLGISCWLFYRNWPAMMSASEGPDGHPNSPACGHLKLPHLN